MMCKWIFSRCVYQSLFSNFGLTLFLDFNFVWMLSVNGVLTIFFLINKVAIVFSKFFSCISCNFFDIFMRCSLFLFGHCFHCGKHLNAKW